MSNDVFGDRFLFAPDGATAVDSKTGWEFVLVPRLEFTMGLTPAEEAAGRRLHPEPNWSVEEMRPVRRETIGPMLMKTVPVTAAEARLPEEEPDHPAFLTLDEAQLLLTRHALAMPTEVQWEGAVRAGSQTLFPWGDELPSDDELEAWLAWDLSRADELPANGLGLKALFFGEWCAGEFIRGGGAFFWPWQDEEWVWCASAMRMPASGLIDGRAALRPVYVPPTPAGDARTR